MSQEQQQGFQACVEQPPAAASRRKRTPKSAEGRRFICECGKAYMSYAALYTHNKCKHNSDSLRYILRDLEEQSEKSIEACLYQEDQHLIENSQELKALKLYLDRFLSRGGQPRDWFHSSRLSPAHEQQAAWLREAKAYWGTHILQQEQKHNELHQTTIDHVLGLFLLRSQQQLGGQHSLFMNGFALALQKSINVVCRGENFTASSSAEGLPWLMNDVVEVMLQGESQQNCNEKRTLTCIIIQFLGKWLNQQFFSRTKLKLNLG